MARLNMRQSATPSTVPAWTPKPMIRRTLLLTLRSSSRWSRLSRCCTQRSADHILLGAFCFRSGAHFFRMPFPTFHFSISGGVLALYGAVLSTNGRDDIHHSECDECGPQASHDYDHRRLLFVS